MTVKQVETDGRKRLLGSLCDANSKVRIPLKTFVNFTDHTEMERSVKVQPRSALGIFFFRLPIAVTTNSYLFFLVIKIKQEFAEKSLFIRTVLALNYS